VAPGGYVYHVLNRGNGRMRLFHKEADYQGFERILSEALEHVPGMRLAAWCLMPNHWHLLLWPRRDGELSDFGH
jgi:putative transposase